MHSYKFCQQVIKNSHLRSTQKTKCHHSVHTPVIVSGGFNCSTPAKLALVLFSRSPAKKPASCWRFCIAKPNRHWNLRLLLSLHSGRSLRSPVVCPRGLSKHDATKTGACWFQLRATSPDNDWTHARDVLRYLSTVNARRWKPDNTLSSRVSGDAKNRCTAEQLQWHQEHTHTHTGESMAGSYLRVTDVERKHLEGRESIRKGNKRWSHTPRM